MSAIDDEVDMLAMWFANGDTVSPMPYLAQQAVSLIEQYGPGLIDVLEPGDVQTIYVAPSANSDGGQCRVYMMPYPLKQGQLPADIAPHYRDKWKEIALLSRNNAHLSYIDPEYAELEGELLNTMAGTYFLHVSQEARVRQLDAISDRPVNKG